VLTFWPYVWQLDSGHTYDEHLVLALKLGVTGVEPVQVSPRFSCSRPPSRHYAKPRTWEATRSTTHMINMPPGNMSKLESQSYCPESETYRDILPLHCADANRELGACRRVASSIVQIYRCFFALTRTGWSISLILVLSWSCELQSTQWSILVQVPPWR
jgi:hypothetical protein